MVVVGGGGFEERPTTLGNSRPPVSQSFPTQMHTVTHTQNVPTAFQLCSDQCRASCPEPWGHSWTWDVWEARGVKPDNTQLLSPPNHLTGFSSLPPPTHQHLQWSLPLWRTALRASPITQCSGRAAGVTAHMSQHDRGVSCHACPLTFPTLRVQAESERREKNTLLPPWLPKCYHMVHSLPLSLMVCLSLSPSLSARHSGCL